MKHAIRTIMLTNSQGTKSHLREHQILSFDQYTGPVVFHRSVDEDQVGGDDDNVAAYDAGHVGLVVGHVVPDGEDEGLVVLGKDDCVVDHPTKLENSQKCSDKPGEIQINICLLGKKRLTNYDVCGKNL